MLHRVEVVVGHAQEREEVRTIMRTAGNGELISAGEGKTFPVRDSRITVKVRGDDTENKYEILEFTMPPGFASSHHVHQRMEQAYYVLEGELEFKLNEQTVRARAGDLVRVPTGVAHAFSNPTKTWANMLDVNSGGGLGKMLEELAQAFPPGTPIDRERWGGIESRYDVIPAAPHASATK